MSIKYKWNKFDERKNRDILNLYATEVLQFAQSIVRKIGERLYRSLFSKDIDTYKALDLLLWGEYEVNLKDDVLTIEVKKRSMSA